MEGKLWGRISQKMELEVRDGGGTDRSQPQSWGQNYWPRQFGGVGRKCEFRFGWAELEVPGGNVSLAGWHVIVYDMKY